MTWLSLSPLPPPPPLDDTLDDLGEGELSLSELTTDPRGLLLPSERMNLDGDSLEEDTAALAERVTVAERRACGLRDLEGLGELLLEVVIILDC